MYFFKRFIDPETTIIEWQKLLNIIMEKIFPNINLVESGFIFFGDKDTDGTYRIKRDGNNLVTQRRESGVWVTKQTITP